MKMELEEIWRKCTNSFHLAKVGTKRQALVNTIIIVPYEVVNRSIISA